MATTPNPATTEWVPLWDLNGIALSSVPPHHVTHETGGVDAITSLSGTTITSGTIADARLSINVLKYTGGYPGGTANFLRADGTFSPPTVPGPPSPHAATHNPGGSDPLQNNAWLNTPNIFTKDQTLVGPAIGLILTDTSQPANLRGFSIRSTGQALVIQPVDDNNSSVNGFVKIDRNSTILAPNGLSSTPLNASNLTSGTVPAARLTNVAILDVANIFTKSQRVTGIRPAWEIQHSGNAVISRVGQVTGDNRIEVTANLWYDGANWNSDDISQASTLNMQLSGYHYFFNAPAGPNPRSGALSLIMRMGPDGAYAPLGLSATPLNASNITSGTVPIANLPANVARTDLDNHFVPQTFAAYSNITGPNSYFAFFDTGGTVDARYWRTVQYNDGNFWLEALNDTVTTYQARFGFDRVGQFYGLLDAGQLNRGTVPLARLPYEEGTFLPILGGTGGESGQSYAPGFQNGNYVKIGNFIHAGLYLQFSNNGIINGNLVVKGLPYKSGGGSATHAASIGYITNLGSPGTVNPRRSVHGYMFGGSSWITLFSGDDINNINMIQMTGADTNIHTQLILSISYRTNY